MDSEFTNMCESCANQKRKNYRKNIKKSDERKNAKKMCVNRNEKDYE